MKTSTSFLLAAFILFSLSSCSSYLLIQKTKDPEINPVKKPCSIVFVNIFDYTSPASPKEKYGDTQHTGVMRLAEGLSSSFSKDESFSFFFADTLKKSNTAGHLTAFLVKDTIIAICERQKTDMLLTLDSMEIFFNWETVVNEDNDLLKEKNFYLYTRFYLSFYSATGGLINRSMIEKSSLYTSRVALSAIVTFKPSVAKTTESVNTLAFEAGQDYVRKFYPTTVNESKEIYGGKAFKESNLYIKLRNWDKAIELLDELTRSPDQNIAIKARHNLSVVREAALMEK